MSGLHSSEIECLARRMLFDENPNDSTIRYYLSSIRWLGLFARDKLTDLTQLKRYVVVVFNTDPHVKPGQHWLAIYRSCNWHLECFDSFGMPPFYYKLSTLFVYFYISLQSFSSALCGNYAIYFIFLRSRNVLFNKIILFLKSRSNSNLHLTTLYFI